MEYKYETSKHNRGVGDPFTIQFTDDARFFDAQGGNTDGVAITTVDRGGSTLTHCSISIGNFLAIGRSLKG